MRKDNKQNTNGGIDYTNIKLDEDAIRQRILDNTNLDEQLDQTLIDRGITKISPETRDKMRITRLSNELAPDDFDDNILRKLLGGPLQKDLDGSTILTSKDGQLTPTENYQVTRNSQGYIVSDESKTENLLDITLSDKLIQRSIFKNVVNTEFEQIELPFKTVNEIENLENQLRILNNEIADLNGTTEGLLNERSTLSVDNETQEELINTLQDTITTLNSRFAVTPPEGTIFSITPKYPDKQKEDLDYWIIENGERRRIKNYAMVQLMLDQDDRTVNSVEHIAASNIQKITRGMDMTVDEMTGNNSSVKSAVDNNIYVPDGAFDSPGTFKIFWPDMQGDSVNDNIKIAAVMEWMWGVGQWAAQDEIPDLAGTGITFSYARELRYYLAKHALWGAARAINPKELAAELVRAAELKKAKELLSASTVAQYDRIIPILNQLTALVDNVDENVLRLSSAESRNLISLAQRVTDAKENAVLGYTPQQEYLTQLFLDTLIRIFPRMDETFEYTELNGPNNGYASYPNKLADIRYGILRLPSLF